MLSAKASLFHLSLASLLFVAGAWAADAGSTVVASAGDASIQHDSTAGVWTLAAGGATLALVAASGRDFQLTSLTGAAGRNWLTTATAGATIVADGTTAAFGRSAAGFAFDSATATNDNGRLQLSAAYLFRPANLLVTRHFIVVNGSPTIEMWTSYQALGTTTVAVANLNAMTMSVAAGQVRWLTGLQGDSADSNVATQFTLEQQTVAAGATFSLGADGRSSSQAVPWFAIDGATEEFYSTLAWSGSWALSLTQATGSLEVTFGLAPMQTDVGGAPVDGPHVLVGIASGSLEQAAAGLRSYVLAGLRNGRAISPLVTYNTWFAYGTDIDEAAMEAEMDHAAKVGTELFVIDAGWYTGAGAGGPFDFDAGLGSWQVDPARFPNGLRPLRDYAHNLGMKFGIWVEPERVNLSTVGAPGAEQAWLATAGGNYGSDHAAQICLADAAARAWVLGQLESLLDAVAPDYLKFDNNMWVNCDRPGHGHGTTDGSFRHVTGLYSILSTLQQNYPNLLIENVSGGGNRLDYGMLRYTDAAWMDDRTAPSVTVRHNVEGLTAAFPPAYLLSFVTDHATEPLHEAPDLPLYVRSRMAGALGLCYRADTLNDADLAAIAAEVSTYKQFRSTLSVAAGALLTPQAQQADTPAWDVLQAAAPDSTAMVVYAFQSDPGAATISIRPAGLDPSATYAVSSVDVGALGTATGSELMANGIDILASPATAAHILTLVVRR